MWLTSEEAAQGGYVDGIVKDFYFTPEPKPAEGLLFRMFQYFLPEEGGMYVKE
jgi:hypothetical protein